MAQLRHHLAREARGVVERGLVRHVAEVHEQHQVADLHAIGHVVEPVDDGLRAARDHAAAVDDLLPGEKLALHLRGRVAHLAAHALADGGDAGVAGRAGIARIDVEAAVIEILRRLGVELLRLGIVFRDADELQERHAVRIGLGAEPLHRLPIAVDDRSAGHVAEIGKIGVEEVVLDAPFPGLDAAAAGNPDSVSYTHRCV